MANKFKRIELRKWQQFENVEIDFNNSVTILTGSNGSGKTTILNLLGRHCGWSRSNLAVPKKNENGAYGWITGWFKSLGQDDNLVGSVQYTETTSANLRIPSGISSVRYDLSIEGQQGVDSFFIPSHRSVFSYRQIEKIPTNPSHLSKINAFNRVSQVNRERYDGAGNNQTANFHIKETLIAWGAFGEGNSAIQEIPEFKDYFLGFEKTLSIVLPQSLGFKKLSVENFEVVVKCEAGDFILDGASGGLTAIIDLAWQVYMFSDGHDKQFTVIIDEIENHLHPTMQRRILSDLVKAFPRASFIVSTHSPLIVNSVQDANVYALRYSDNRRIVSQKLDFDGQARTASEILDEVLGVSFTMPIWAEEKIDAILDELSGKQLQKDDLNKVLLKLKDAGLDRFFPTAIEKIANNGENYEANR